MIHFEAVHAYYYRTYIGVKGHGMFAFVHTGIHTIVLYSSQ